ncbi:methyltransferase-domain-containing protein [Sporodiniella umbellata]|nr:methyltransferase-domain-containing protein [Sporodiniella umbellata]
MQPLFETSGWSLPKKVAKEKAKPKKSTESTTTQEADQLQAQLSSMASGKKRSLEEATMPLRKKKSVPEKETEEGNALKQNKTAKQNKKQKAKSENKTDPPKKVAQAVTQESQSAKDKKSKKQKLQKLLAKSEEKAKENVKEKAKGNAKEKASVAKVEEGELTALQKKMKAKLSGARFRWLNEMLYTTVGKQSFELFQDKPELFDEYHEGFRHQVESWPENPVNIMIDQLARLPKKTVIADLGCGDAMIAQTLTEHGVLSFDLVAKNAWVTACDISRLPLEAGSVDVAVFSLSLMGTNYIDFLKEAHRVLKPGGELKIAEVVSRFSDLDGFISLLETLGFDFMDREEDNTMFVMLYFTKQAEDRALEEEDDGMLAGLSKTQIRALKKGAGVKKSSKKLQSKARELLKPCLYKKR